MATPLRILGDSGIGVRVVAYSEGDPRGTEVEVKEGGILNLATPETVSSFRLRLFVPPGTKWALCQRDNSEEHGHYESTLHRLVGVLGEAGYEGWEMKIPIVVRRENYGKKVFTAWREPSWKEASDRFRANKVDCWNIAPDGVTQHREIAVLTLDNGKTFRVIEHLRWHGLLAMNPDGEIVGIPTDNRFGAFDERYFPILEYPPFEVELEKATLPSWKGSEEELDPPLELPTDPHTAVIKFWHICMGQNKGQGLAFTQDGSACWILGQDIEDDPPDGIWRLYRGTRVSYEAVENTGRNPRLKGVRIL